MRAIALLAISCIASSLPSQPSINIVYPPENGVVRTAKPTFIYGHAQPPHATVLIEGVRARRYANGTFMVVVPVVPGLQTVTAMAIADGDTAFAQRTFTAPPYFFPTDAASPAIDTSFVFPDEPIWLMPGDSLLVIMKGTPNASAFFAIDSLTAAVPMQELVSRRRLQWGAIVYGRGEQPYLPEVDGLYLGRWQVPLAAQPGSYRIRLSLAASAGAPAAWYAPGRMEILARYPPSLGRVLYELRSGRSETASGEIRVIPAGAVLPVTARDGAMLRLQMSADTSAWVPAAALALLPPGSVPATATLLQWRAVSVAAGLRLELDLSRRAPYWLAFDNEQKKLALQLIAGANDSNAHPSRSTGDLPARISLVQQAPDRMSIALQMTERPFWGYHSYYRDSTLVLDVRLAPQIDRERPLQGLLICIDPGHEPDLGAVGATGIAENTTTVTYAAVLQEMLIARGARTILTRVPDQGCNLATRAAFAEAVDADIFLSLHFNSIPDGLNPFIRRGAGTYYYHPHSRDLAQSIQRRLLAHTRQRDFGARFGNLAVCRLAAMPAVLLEPAFIVHPEEEMKILDPRFREQVCQAIAEGLETFLRQYIP